MVDLSLKELQAAFMASVYALDSETNAPEFVHDQHGISADERLNIYRGSVLGGLSQALSDLFPAVKTGVGDAFFDAMALRYIAAHPSKSQSLDDYGEHFPEFISAFEPLRDHPYLVDVARLDWAWHLAFHAADQAPMKVASLQALDEHAQSELHLVLNASLYLIESDYPVLDIWRLNRGLDKDSHIDMNAAPQSVAVWRQGYDLRVESVTTLEKEFLELLKQRKNLGTICSTLLSKHDNELIISTLVLSIERGWLVD